MSEPTFKVTIQQADNQAPLFERELTGAVELGRQNHLEPPPYCLQGDSNGPRIIIAPIIDTSIPRRWFKIEMAGPKLCKITNISSRSPVRVDDREYLEGGVTRTFELPATIPVGQLAIRITGPDTGDQEMEGLPERTVAPSTASRSRMPRPVSFAESTQSPDRLLEWLQTVLSLLQNAVSTTEFYQIAARSLVGLMNMDSGRVLLLEKGEWHIKASEAPPDPTWKPSQNLLRRVQLEKRTYRHAPGGLGGSVGGGGGSTSSSASISSSMAGITMAVVAPILNAQEEVIGVLYGERRTTPTRVITPLDAKLVEVLAGGVAAGLARLEQEAKAIHNRTRMEQFFTPKLARHLESNPEMLTGKTCEISVLFADIRKFSTISHKLGPGRTMELINSVLEELCECVLAEDGVLVDFGGDDIMAMWGAPIEQPDHADRACRAALAMLTVIPKLNDRWQAEIEDVIDIGVGVNSGPASCGNVGSTHKFKYGPLGSCVNLASRVQGLTKYFQARPLITEQTKSKLTRPMPMRRLAQVRVVNIPDPVTLYELPAAENEAWIYLRKQYEDALTAFERKDFPAAAGLIGALMTNPLYRNDGPSLVLMQRAAKCLIEPPNPFSPVIEMTSK